MKEPIEQGFMVFLAEGAEGIGAVRATTADSILVYVENGGESRGPLAAVKGVHDQKGLAGGRLQQRPPLVSGLTCCELGSRPLHPWLPEIQPWEEGPLVRRALASTLLLSASPAQT